jgi:hypothetical protein
MKAQNILLLLTAFSVSFVLDCQTKVNSDGSVTVTPPPDPQVNINSQYGPNISVEIWTGTSLEYKEGKVYGNSLSRIASPPAFSGLQNNLATISYGGTFLIVVGVDDAGTKIYVTSRQITGYTSTRTFTITSSGAIN